MSALLLVGSALTVFATDFEFSAPNLVFEDYNEVYIVRNYDSSTQSYSNPYILLFSYLDTNEYIYYVTTFLTQSGFQYFSQNGVNINSMYQFIDDFLSGGVGIPEAVYLNYVSSEDYYYAGSVPIYSIYDNEDYIFNIQRDLNNQFFNYESQYNTLLAQYNSLISQYQLLLTDYQNLQILNNDLQAAINSLVSDNNSLNAQLSELQSEYNSLETRFNDLQTQYNDLVSFYSEELTRLLNENNELRSYLQAADTEINNLEYEINRLRQANAEEYMRGYTQAMEDNDLFAEGLYSIFSAPFTLVAEIAEIEIFGTSIVKIVGIVLLFVVLSIVLGFLWKILPLV